MSFVPALPFGGIAGWRYLQGAGGALRQAHAETGPVRRAADAFTEAAPALRSAADVSSDRTLRSVALTAFGLQDDLPNVHFVERVLSQGATDPGALSRRLTDTRYRAMAAAFGFDRAGAPAIAAPEAAGAVRTAFEAQSFEAAIGEAHPELRLALAMDRELPEIANSGLSTEGKWFTVMGTPSLRAVFEGALGTPEGFGTLDVDRQLSEFMDRASRILGTDDLSAFAEPGLRDDLAIRFLARAQAEEGPSPTMRGMAALTILGG